MYTVIWNALNELLDTAEQAGHNREQEVCREVGVNRQEK